MVLTKPLLPSSSTSSPAAKKKSNKLIFFAATIALTLLLGTLYIDSFSNYSYFSSGESHKSPSFAGYETPESSAVVSHRFSSHSASHHGFKDSSNSSASRESSPDESHTDSSLQVNESSKGRLLSSKSQNGGKLSGLYKWISRILGKADHLKPRILVWTGFFGEKHWLSRLKEIGDCPVDCEVTWDRNLKDQSDAVVFHARDIHPNDIPERRPNSTQRWVLFNLESPVHSYGDNFNPLDGKIDWTATYRLDSDIYTPYGKVIPRRNPKGFTKPTYREKSSLICWIVSNCKTSSQRDSYVNILTRYAPVKIYGRCGELKCPTAKAGDCYETASKFCKFYLSFENSLCMDYVTEKLFLALKTDMVPIVMGGADYSKILPNHSYIDALEYDDPKDLATYLYELDSDPARYMQYHAWKKDFEVIDWAAQRLSCDLCKKLHKDGEDRLNGNGSSIERYPNLWNWWVHSSPCYNWKEYLFTHPV